MQECGAWAINQTLLRLFFSFLRIPPNISPDLAVLLGAPRSHCGPVGGEEKYRNTGRLKIQKYAAATCLIAPRQWLKLGWVALRRERGNISLFDR